MTSSPPPPPPPQLHGCTPCRQAANLPITFMKHATSPEHFFLD